MLISYIQKFYTINGYVIIPKVFDSKELLNLQHTMDTVTQKAELSNTSNKSFTFEQIKSKKIVKRIYDPISLNKTFFDTVKHMNIINIISNLIGPNIEFHHSKAHLKHAYHGSEIHWHQDFPFLPHTNFDLLTVMIAIDGTTERNGCLQVIPGSHQWPLINHEVDNTGFRKISQEKLLSKNDAKIVNVEVPAGGISIHHCLTYHSSLPNQSNKSRRSLIHLYRAADALQLAGRTNHNNYGMLVNGKKLNIVRLVDTEFELHRESTDSRDYKNN